MDDRQEKGREFIRLTRLSSIGIALVLCTFIGYGIGFYLDVWLHTRLVFTIIFLVFGIAAGFLNAFRTIAKDSD
jgi:ATP synthase protein I